MFFFFPMKFRHDRKKESDYRCYDKERDSDYAQIIGVISCRFDSKNVDYELHIHLTQNHSYISSKKHPNSIREDFLEKLFLEYQFGLFKIDDVVFLIEKIEAENDSHSKPENPVP